MTISDIRRSSFRVTFGMRAEDRLCAEGYCVYVGFGYVEQRATPFPERWRAALDAAARSE